MPHSARPLYRPIRSFSPVLASSAAASARPRFLRRRLCTVMARGKHAAQARRQQRNAFGQFSGPISPSKGVARGRYHKPTDSPESHGDDQTSSECSLYERLGGKWCQVPEHKKDGTRMKVKQLANKVESVGEKLHIYGTRLRTLRAQVQEEVGSISARFVAAEQSIEYVNNKVENMEAQLKALKKNLRVIDQKLDSLTEKMLKKPEA